MLVTVSGVLADREAKSGELRGGIIMKCWESVPVIPREQFEINWPAVARTSLGDKGMSNAWGMGESWLSKLNIVLWRASIDKMEAAAVKMCGF